jgi:hypothetical protein
MTGISPVANVQGRKLIVLHTEPYTEKLGFFQVRLAIILFLFCAMLSSQFYSTVTSPWGGGEGYPLWLEANNVRYLTLLNAVAEQQTRHMVHIKYMSLPAQPQACTKAKFLDVIGTKVLRVFRLVIHNRVSPFRL